MTDTATKGTTAPATSMGGRVGGAREITRALATGSRAYVNGVFQLGRTLGGFGREIAVDTGRQRRATIAARRLHEVAELQAAWVQHRVETSTAPAKEFADLAHSNIVNVIAPFVALVKQDKAP